MNLTNYRLLHLIALVLACIALAQHATAQASPYKFDFGGSLGMSGYLGDANNSSILKHPGFAIDANARYIANARWAVKGTLGMATLSGNTADMENVLPGNAQYEFTSTVVDLGVKGEFNFFAYGIGETFKRLSRITPYLTVGAGVCMSFADGHSCFAPTLPMGVGVKYKLGDRLNLIGEFTMTKCFSDKIDTLTDLTGIKTDFVKNTDWISRISVGFSYEFGERCETCHYVD